MESLYRKSITNTLSIEEMCANYYSTPVEQRDSNEWVKVLHKFILDLCNKYHNIDDKEDLYQIAWVGATKALHSYKPVKGVKFTTYLSRCIINEFKLRYRKTKPNYIDKDKPELGIIVDISLNSHYDNEDGDDSTGALVDVLGETDKNIEKSRIEEEFYYYLNNINKDKEVASICIDYIFNCIPQPQIARTYRISQSYVSRKIRITLKDFRKYYFKNYL